MKVVIVGKTRMGGAACIGGITFSGESVRLIAADREINDTVGLEYELGEVWDVRTMPDPALIPPHIENVIVHEKRRLPALDDVPTFIRRHMPPVEGGPEHLYEGLTEATRFGSLYISNRNGIPSFSTMFWQPDQPLSQNVDGKRIRYSYATHSGEKKLTFVGFQDPLAEIPPGTLLRVSLAHWWRPDDKPDKELRCYVQLSGWFLAQQSYWSLSPPGREISKTGMEMALPPMDFQFPEMEDPFQDMAGAPYFDPALLPSPAQNIVKSGKPLAAEATLEDAARLLAQVFGFDAFRPLQREIITRLLAGEDTVAIMPTGSGKSLCYQLPALLLPGLTVVVSPLISLMQNQVDALRELAVPAAFLNSTLSYDQYLSVRRRVVAEEIKLLYVAPETLLRPETLALLDSCHVSCLTVDEAHCISEWGHDFRPEYGQLLTVRRRNPEAVCLAVTATATARVQEDIIQSLEMPAAGRFIASFDRPNLFLSAEVRTDEAGQLLAFLAGRQQQAGIIYCPTRQQVDDTAAFLRARKWDALPYHAGLTSEMREAHQRRFIYEDNVLIVATIAFGMGIDKPDVRFVVHLGLPKDIESYYQQIGRAGRDGMPADCLLLYSAGDSQTIYYFISQQAVKQQAGARFRLNQLLSFAETGGCRRIPLLNYFGEEVDAQKCDNCDNCLRDDDEDLVDVTIQAQMFLSCVKRTGEFFGAAHVIKVLRGSRAKAVLNRGHDRLSTYGIGSGYSQQEWSALAEQFIGQGLVTRDPQYGSLRLTPKAFEVFKGQTVMARAPQRPASHARAHGEPVEYDRELFAILREKRRVLASDAGLPPYVIFPDRSLIEMSTYYPQSVTALAGIYGVGQHKIANYGDLFVSLIREYCEPRGIQSTSHPVRQIQTRSIRPVGLSSRTEEYIQLYVGGTSLAEIANEYGVKQQTIIGHLYRYVQEGNRVRGDGLREVLSLSKIEEDEVRAVFLEVGMDSLGPAYRALDGRVNYDNLAIVRLLVALPEPA